MIARATAKYRCQHLIGQLARRRILLAGMIGSQQYRLIRGHGIRDGGRTETRRGS